jgi:hypothetical protein
MKHRRRADQWQDEAEQIERSVDELLLDDQDDGQLPSLPP